METRADGKALYNIRRFFKGRGFKRYLTREIADRYRGYGWKLTQLTQHKDQGYTVQTGRISLAKYPAEFLDNKRQKTAGAVISYDDILDVQLAIKKGI